VTCVVSLVMITVTVVIALTLAIVVREQRLTPHRKRYVCSFDCGSQLFGGGAALLFLSYVVVNAFIFAFVVVGRRRLHPLVIGNCFATGGCYSPTTVIVVA